MLELLFLWYCAYAIVEGTLSIGRNIAGNHQARVKAARKRAAKRRKAKGKKGPVGVSGKLGGYAGALGTTTALALYDGTIGFGRGAQEGYRTARSKRVRRQARRRIKARRAERAAAAAGAAESPPAPVPGTPAPPPPAVPPAPPAPSATPPRPAAGAPTPAAPGPVSPPPPAPPVPPATPPSPPAAPTPPAVTPPAAPPPPPAPPAPPAPVTTAPPAAPTGPVPVPVPPAASAEPPTAPEASEPARVIAVPPQGGGAVVGVAGSGQGGAPENAPAPGAEVGRTIVINTPEGPVSVPETPVLTHTVSDLPSLLIWFALTFQDAQMEAQNSEAEASWIRELEAALTRFEGSLADDKVPVAITNTIADLRAKMKLLDRAHTLQADMATNAAEVSRGSAYHARDTYLGMWEAVVVARGLVAENTHFN